MNLRFMWHWLRTKLGLTTSTDVTEEDNTNPWQVREIVPGLVWIVVRKGGKGFNRGKLEVLVEDSCGDILFPNLAAAEAALAAGTFSTVSDRPGLLMWEFNPSKAVAPDRDHPKTRGDLGEMYYGHEKAMSLTLREQTGERRSLGTIYLQPGEEHCWCNGECRMNHTGVKVARMYGYSKADDLDRWEHAYTKYGQTALEELWVMTYRILDHAIEVLAAENPQPVYL